ncbi:hypothetical protein CEXT_334351 [Caerostris extrusa]|uniref:Uncharacterized protein n=1 Tax=Caerostris extrusa TaxID=172846 RepID=A0AAV4QF25_CAEEX|nr:hypothetical protein CEXT_334351 [Caerostris extrusa]
MKKLTTITKKKIKILTATTGLNTPQTYPKIKLSMEKTFSKKISCYTGTRLSNTYRVFQQFRLFFTESEFDRGELNATRGLSPMLQEEMDFAPAEGSDPFQDHLRPPPDVQLELIPNLTQHQINCEGLRRTTALLNKATSDLAMTIKYWEDLGHNSDTDLGKTMERKINELTNQKKGLEKQLKRHTSSKHYVAHEERHVTPDVPINTNRFAPLNQDEILNNADIATRIPPIMVRQTDNIKLQLKKFTKPLKPKSKLWYSAN